VVEEYLILHGRFFLDMVTGEGLGPEHNSITPFTLIGATPTRMPTSPLRDRFGIGSRGIYDKGFVTL